MSLRDIDWREHPKAGGYAAIIEEAEKKHGIPAGLLGAVIHRESRFNPNAVSEAGAVGLAQLMPIHHSEVDPRNPAEAINYSARYLSRLHDRFDSWDYALAAYNAGEARTARRIARANASGTDWLSQFKPETVDYVNALSPERNQYPASSGNTEDPLMQLAKEADEKAAAAAEDDRQALLMLQAEPQIEENLRTRGWGTDQVASAARGPLKAVSAYLKAAEGIGEWIDERTGRLRINNPFGDKSFLEYIPPSQVKAENSGLTLNTLVTGERKNTDNVVSKTLDAGAEAIGKPQTKTGAVVEGVSQFLSGFLLTRRITSGASAMQGTSTSSKVLGSLAEGAGVSALTFEAQEANLADFVQSFPSLQNPVTEWMAGNEGDGELEGRLKNAVADAVGGSLVEAVMHGLRVIRAGRKVKLERALETPDARPEIDLARVDRVSIAKENPLPPKAPEVAPEGSASGKAADEIRVVEEIDEATGELVVRHGTDREPHVGVGIAVETENSIRIRRVDVEDGQRGKGIGLALLRQFARRAASRGIPLFSDVSISPAQVRVYEKLKAEGFDVRRNAAEINPETGNLVSADPRTPVFEVAPPKADTAPAPTPAKPATVGAVNAEGKPVDVVEASQLEKKTADYANDPIDVRVERLREEIGLTDELVEEVRAKIKSGEVRPEEVADLIGINGDRINWSGVTDEKSMAGLLNTISRVIDDTVGGMAGYGRVSVATVEKLAKEIGASAEQAFELFERLKANGGIEAGIVAARRTLHASAAKLHRLASVIGTDKETPEALLELAIHDRRHMLLQATVRGSKSMIARALRMMQEGVEVDEAAFRLSKARKERDIAKAQEAVDRAKRKRAAKPKKAAAGSDDTGMGLMKSADDAAFEHLQQLLDNAKKANRKLSEADVHDALGQMGYRPGQVRKLAKAISDAKSAADVHKISRTVSFGRNMQARLATLYINNILSGLPTLAVNVTSGWLKMIETIVERYGAGVVGYARGGFDKYELIAAHRSVLATKVMFTSAFKVAAAAFKEGLPQTDVFMRSEIAMRAGNAPGLIENAITLPSRGILTVDEYFKHIFYQQELTARAVEIAAGKVRAFGLTGKMADDIFEQEFKEVMSNPTDAVRLDAIENARYQTFQNNLESSLGNALIRATNGTPALKFVIPFVRTPANIAKQALLERTPLALARKKVWKAIREGDRAGNTVAVRTFLALGAFTFFFNEALEGRLKGSFVGRGSNKNTADLDKQTNYTWNGVQFSRLDPYGTVLGLTADLAALYQDWRLRLGADDPESSVPDQLGLAFANIIGILSENVLDKTYFKGISDAVEAIANAESAPQFLNNYISNLGANLIPYSSLQRQFARTHDEYAREAFDFSDRLMAQTPWERQNLPYRRDYLGRPIKEVERLGPDWLSPILIAKDDPDPVARALAGLEMSYRMPERDLDGVPLNAQQYSFLLEKRGQFIYDRLSRKIESGSWDAMSRTDRIEWVREAARSGTTIAKRELLKSERDNPNGLKQRIRNRDAAIKARDDARALLRLTE
jgi:GNAT superfamily N-acetyltransferase